MNFDIPEGDRHLIEAYQSYRQAVGGDWRSLILAGYLPCLKPRLWRLRLVWWEPSPTLLNEWQRKKEAG